MMTNSSIITRAAGIPGRHDLCRGEVTSHE
jgi:hypothetical protein